MGLFSKNTPTVPATDTHTPVPAPAEARLCEDCGKWKTWTGITRLCAGCRYAALLETQPKPSPSGEDCAICGLSEATQWTTGSVQQHRKVRQSHTGQMTSVPSSASKIMTMCQDCKDLADFLAAPMGREQEEGILDARLGQLLRVTGKVPQEPAYVHSGQAPAHFGRRGGGSITVFYGVVRAVVECGPMERPLSAWEVEGHSTPGVTREPLWWILRNANSFRTARSYVDQYHTVKQIPMNHEGSTVEQMSGVAHMSGELQKARNRQRNTPSNIGL